MKMTDLCAVLPEAASARSSCGRVRPAAPNAPIWRKARRERVWSAIGGTPAGGVGGWRTRGKNQLYHLGGAKSTKIKTLLAGATRHRRHQSCPGEGCA